MKWEMIIRSLLYQSPVLLVCLLGGFLAIFLMGKSKGAGLLAMLGCGAMFVARIGGIVVAEYIFSLHMKDDVTHKELTNYTMINSIVFSLGFATGLLLLLIAAMMGRKPKPDRRDDDRPRERVPQQRATRVPEERPPQDDRP